MNTGLLVLRLVLGLLLVGHGSQKLFGWFGGPGLAGTGGFFHSLGFRPGKPMAIVAGVSEAGAGALLALGLFVERAYCRFLCPLGGVLAALDRFHLLDRLRRRAECGSPCRRCEAACPVRAIEKSGKIVSAECFQCLDCQVEYFDDKRCPPLVAARRSRSETQVPVHAS